MPKFDAKQFPLSGVDVLISSAVAGGVYLLLSKLAPFRPLDSPGAVFGQTGVLALAFCVPPIVLLRLRRRRALRVWVPPRDLGRDLAAGLVLGLLLAVMNGLALRIGTSHEDLAPSGWLDGVVFGSSGFRDVAVLLLALGLVSPVAEEIFFRGVLYPAIRKRLPAAPAIVLTSAVFSAAHYDSMRMHAFLLGLVAAILVEYTGSLVPAVLAHMGVNAAFVLFLANGGMLTLAAPVWAMVAFFVILNVLLFALGKTLFVSEEVNTAEARRGDGKDEGRSMKDEDGKG